MNSLIGYSGRHYMDSIGSGISANSDSYKGEQEFFDPESADLDQEVTIIVNGAQESFSTTNWCITAVVTLLGGFGMLCQWQSIEAFAHLCFKG